MEEILASGAGEHTNLIQLLLSLLSSGFFLRPQGYKFKQAEIQLSPSYSERQTVLCH